MKDPNITNSFDTIINFEIEKLQKLNISTNDLLHEIKRSIIKAKKEIGKQTIMNDEDEVNEDFKNNIERLRGEIEDFLDILQEKAQKTRQINDLKTSLKEYKEEFIPPSNQIPPLNSQTVFPKNII